MVSSQQEEDDLAKAIQLSLQETKVENITGKQLNLVHNLDTQGPGKTQASSSSNGSSALYPLDSLG